MENINVDILIWITAVGVMLFGFYLFFSNKKKEIIIIADNCSECPLMSKKLTSNEMDYECKLLDGKIHNSLSLMNKDCPCGGKIEITIKEN